MPRLSRVDIALTLLLTVSFDVLTWWTVEISVIFALLLQTLSGSVCYYVYVTPSIIEPISAVWSTALKHEIKLGIVSVLVVLCTVSGYVRCLSAGILTFRCIVVLDFVNNLENYCHYVLSLIGLSKLDKEHSSSTESTPSENNVSLPPQLPNISISVQSGQQNVKPVLMQLSSSPKSPMTSPSFQISSSKSTTKIISPHAQQHQLSRIQIPSLQGRPAQHEEQEPEERRVNRKHGRDNDDCSTADHHHRYNQYPEKFSIVPPSKARRVVIHPFQTAIADENTLMDIVVASNGNRKTSSSHFTARHRPVLKRKVNSRQEEDIEVIQDWMEDNSRTKRRKFLEMEQLARPSIVSTGSQNICVLFGLVCFSYHNNYRFDFFVFFAICIVNSRRCWFDLCI